MRSLVTLTGNLTSDVTLRSTAGGSVANFRMAVNDRWFDQRTQQWRERVVYLGVSAWRQLGENAAGSLRLGQPVVVLGRLTQRQFERDGQTHTVTDVEAQAIGHDLARGTAQFVRSPRGPQTAELAVPDTEAAVTGSHQDRSRPMVGLHAAV